MSGHLLSTVNHEAGANEYEVPPIGARVIYHARPGTGRNGQLRFAADVMHTDPKTGLCTLWVLYGREDYREMINIRMRTDQEPYHCWDYVEDDFEEIVVELAEAIAKMEETRAELEELRKAVFGGFKPVTTADGKVKSVYDLLQEFEQRVFAAENGVPQRQAARKR